MTVIDSALMTVIKIWKDFMKIFHYLLNIILSRELIQIMKYWWDLNYKKQGTWIIKTDVKVEGFVITISDNNSRVTNHND